MTPTIVLYTHDDYKDIWPITFGQMDIFLKEYKKIIFVNRDNSDIPQNYIKIYYDDRLTYKDRVLSCLHTLGNDVILFLHEDMILYDEPNHAILKEYSLLIRDNKADFIKLIKAGTPPFTPSDLHENLLYCEDKLLFSIQPTISTTSKLKNIFSLTGGSNIWEFEQNVSDICIRENYINSFMSCDSLSVKRGISHWDSVIFPYIATAIVKGKWNYSEYKNELDLLFSKYSVNKHIRGET